MLMNYEISVAGRQVRRRNYLFENNPIHYKWLIVEVEAVNRFEMQLRQHHLRRSVIRIRANSQMMWRLHLCHCEVYKTCHRTVQSTS